MGRSRLDGAMWARIAKRGGTDPSVAGQDAQYLIVDPDSGALVVTGAGAAATATALRVQDGDTTRTALVGEDRALRVRDVTREAAQNDTANFPTEPLLANATFTGAWVDVLSYAAITVAVFTDQPSAANGAVIEFSTDGVNVVRSVSTSIPANVGSYFSLAPQARFYRLRYTNGATAQSVLRGQVLLRFMPPAMVEQPLGATITDLNVAQVSRSAVSARLPDGRYLPVAITSDQRLLVSTGHTQPLTDAQLRATPVPVDLADTHLATEATLAAQTPLLTTIRDEQYRRTDPLPAGTNIIGRVLDRQATTLYAKASATHTTGGVSPAFDTSELTRAAIDVNVSAVEGVAAELRVFLDRLGADGLWYPIWSPAARTAVGMFSTTVGQGMIVGQSLAASCRFRWEITGTSPSFTFSAGVVGK